MIGFILINAVPEYEHEIYIELLKISGVIEVHSLVGEYALIAKVEFQDVTELGEIILNKIKTMKGVLCTKTLLWAVRSEK
ncbi:unnamed protein product [marine sediment metagenome]|jgi:DNA-binding Lrp family transcriptional regulator|uniref:Transcription regulator AsnC/Lrp ligand binding domain-containing protein n=1 Tax=marine sediment metagenome TaxID=412755 RepID=X1S6L5_9ZZZZ